MSASGGAGDEDKKPNDQMVHINLKVKGQDGNEVFFRIKRSTQMRKLMNAYCDRQSVDMNSIAFLLLSKLLMSWRWRRVMKSMQCYIKLEAAILDAALLSLIFNLVYVSRLFRVILSECWYNFLICFKMVNL
ncbi:hypothetical protein AABB24_035784 [Solanum stoloniferum]|uniref:Rad60/SUMO-like domain-containing protein n=1 Tax=Solanum stoloniferum TaxID=62892 RepID=A0ABD2R941_9SOLN